MKAFSHVEVLNQGNISLDIALDNQSPSAILIKDPSDPNGGATNHVYSEYYDSTNLKGTSQHTVEITVTELNGGHIFSFESYAYLPSFDTLVDMPSPTFTSRTGNSHASRRIAGIASGVVVGVLLIVVLAVFLYRRRKHKLSLNSTVVELERRSKVSSHTFSNAISVQLIPTPFCLIPTSKKSKRSESFHPLRLLQSGQNNK